MLKKMLTGMLFVILVLGFAGISNATDYEYQIIDIEQFIPAGANIRSVRINDNNIIAGHYKEADPSQVRYIWWYNLDNGVFDSEYLSNTYIDTTEWSYNTINLNNSNEIILRSRIFDIDTETWLDTPITGVIDKNDNGVYLTYHYIWDDGVITNFHPPGAYSVSWGYSLNNSNNVTGWFRSCIQCYHNGFIWNSATDEYTIISIPEHLHMLDINDNNIAIGRYPGYPKGTLATIDGYIERIDIIPNSLYSHVYGINNNNVIVGKTDLGNGDRVFIGTPKPVAYFTADPVSGTAPLTATFTDESTGIIDTWEWDFGDNSTSTAQNPSHVYNDPGAYTVNLTVNGPGGTNTETKTDYITVAHPPPIAKFSADVISGVHPLTVNFTDESTGEITSRSWAFGDDSTSTNKNPNHTYDNPGTYTVSLTCIGPGGSDTETKNDYIVVDYIAPIANFVAESTKGLIPFAVTFTEKSTGDITDWLWDFGDTESSTDQNPTHIYTEEGLYTVSLAVSGPEGLDTEIKTDYIAAYEELTLTNPNGGEIIPSGSYYTIEWVAPFIADNFRLLLSLDNGKTWEKIEKGIIDTSRGWDAPTPKQNKKKCLVKVQAFDSNGKKIATDKSDAPFTIEVLTITSPQEGEPLTSRTDYTIEWDTNETRKPVDKVYLKYSKNGGTTWKPIAKIVGDNPGEYLWTVPDVNKTKKECMIKVVLKNANNKIVGKAMSDGFFTIDP